MVTAAKDRANTCSASLPTMSAAKMSVISWPTMTWKPIASMAGHGHPEQGVVRCRGVIGHGQVGARHRVLAQLIERHNAVNDGRPGARCVLDKRIGGARDDGRT